MMLDVAGGIIIGGVLLSAAYLGLNLLLPGEPYQKSTIGKGLCIMVPVIAIMAWIVFFR